MRPLQFNLLPDVVKNLLIINGLFYLATIVFAATFGIDLTDILGLHFMGSEKFRPYQFVTYMFMHGSLGHIFFNMFAVWMFGSALENLWGSKRFLIYYLATGFGAALIHYMVVYFSISETLQVIDYYIQNPDFATLTTFLESEHMKVVSYDIQNAYNHFTEVYNTAMMEGRQQDALAASVRFMEEYRVAFLNAPVVVGASGALFGLLLAFGMMFPNHEIYLYFLFPIKAKYFVALYGALELWSGIQNNPSDNIAHFAHLGGMLFGFVILQFWSRNRRRDYF